MSLSLPGGWGSWKSASFSQPLIQSQRVVVLFNNKNTETQLLPAAPAMHALNVLIPGSRYLGFYFSVSRGKCLACMVSARWDFLLLLTNCFVIELYRVVKTKTFAGKGQFWEMCFVLKKKVNFFLKGLKWKFNFVNIFSGEEKNNHFPTCSNL